MSFSDHNARVCAMRSDDPPESFCETACEICGVDGGCDHTDEEGNYLPGLEAELEEARLELRRRDLEASAALAAELEYEAKLMEGAEEW